MRIHWALPLSPCRFARLSSIFKSRSSRLFAFITYCITCCITCSRKCVNISNKFYRHAVRVLFLTAFGPLEMGTGYKTVWETDSSITWNPFYMLYFITKQFQKNVIQDVFVGMHQLNNSCSWKVYSQQSLDIT
jgi:hypothetical protein